MTEEVQKFLTDLIDFKDWDAAKWKATDSHRLSKPRCLPG
jgi:hypothetical protein